MMARDAWPMAQDSWQGPIRAQNGAIQRQNTAQNEAALCDIVVFNVYEKGLWILIVPKWLFNKAGAISIRWKSATVPSGTAGVN